MRKRRIFSLLFSILCFMNALLPLSVRAAEHHWWPEKIRVGIFDYSGLFFDENGDIGGQGIAYLDELANCTGWQYEYVRGTWQELLDALVEGDIDLLFPGQKTAEREQVLDFSKYDCGVEYTTLFVPKTSSNIYYGDAPSFEGLRVAMMSGSYQNDVFDSYAKKNSISYTPVFFESWEDADVALSRGEVDARVSGSLRSLPNEKVVLRISPEPYYFMSSKKNPLIKEAIDAAMGELQTWESGFHIRISEENASSSVGQTAFTREESDYVKANGNLRIAYHTGWTPLIYHTNKGVDGILYDVLTQISQDSGLNFQYVPADSLSEMELLLSEGQVDLISYYPRSRLQKLHPTDLILTKNYINVPLSLAMRTDSQQSIKTVALPEGQVDLARIARELYPDALLSYYKDVYDCLHAVSKGQADVALENDYILSQLLEAYGNLKIIRQPALSYPLHIAISPDENPVLLSVLNKSISHISLETINAAVVTHSVQVVNSHFFFHFMQKYWIFLLLAFAAIAFWLIFKWKRSLERHAYLDPLTGCLNQAKFVIELERRMRDRYTGRYAIVCFDIDRFKVINDIYGFRSGNQVLQDIVKVLAAYLTHDELFCRSSGDNFIMLLANGDLLEPRVAFLMERICDTSWAKENIRFNVSTGIYVMNESIDGVHIAIDRANLARQNAKKDYNKLVVYSEAMRKEVLRKQELESRLDEAIANSEFCVYYQPKYSVDTGRIVGAEALVRWITPDGSIIGPDEFIPVFENNGTIVKLDLYVFRQVCANIQKWRDAGVAPFPISVNLSRVHLYQEDFYQDYLTLLRRYNVPSYLVELELTESTIFENQQQLVLIMERLKEQGLLISMDDFGSGYSSLNLLKDLPIDTIKLDREFFNTSANDKRGKLIIEYIVAMAHRLDILVVSEGVETLEQVQFLQQIHCHVAQGYYYSKPLPVREFELRAFDKVILLKQ